MEPHFNDTLKAHVTNECTWQYRNLMGLLHEWSERFITEFDLNIPTPALSIDHIRPRAIATYRQGRNGFGLLHEITFNTQHLTRTVAETLETLLHELLHGWQELHGRPGRNNYHNKEFREKALFYGLRIDSWGHSLGVEQGLFTDLLDRFEVDTTSLPLPHNLPIRIRGRSKMKKWSCSCTNIRAAVEIEAQCLKCGQVFRLIDLDW